MQPDSMQPPIQANIVVRNIGQLITIAQKPIIGASGILQVISNAAIAVHDGVIVWIGQDDQVELMFDSVPTSKADGITIVDAQGVVVTPGFVDSHTHLIFAGDRSEEFHLRRAGISYGELLTQGRGILTTVNATRSADTQLLTEMAMTRLHTMCHYGTTTVEAKTGYGLDMITEEACLRILNNLNALETSPSYEYKQVRVVPTFLGAHVVPLEYRERRSAYIDLIVEEMLPSFVGLARFCDVFCEREAFTVDECHRILANAKALGYELKIHADQLSPSGGAKLAAELGAISADHLDHADDADLDRLRDAGVVATLLPGCSYSLRSPYPSARRFIDHGLHVALATDFNPGTSYCENMQMILSLAMSSMDMSIEEALQATTINGARALALQEEIGSIEVGKRCELALWSIRDYHEVGYHFGVNLIQSVFTVS
jgi:imidazolonepropionase